MKLQFYCTDCEKDFESEPDGTGYEQAPCPSCNELCMTMQFYEEEKERHQEFELYFHTFWLGPKNKFGLIYYCIIIIVLLIASFCVTYFTSS